MSRFKASAGEGILITLVGIIGFIRVLDSLPYAGPMIEMMLYTLFFIFIAITLIGIKIIKNALES